MNVTSLALGTGNNDPDCLLEMMDGRSPELSEHFGLSQFTLTSRSVALSMVMSGGQKPHVGASVSGRMRIINIKRRPSSTFGWKSYGKNCIMCIC